MHALSCFLLVVLFTVVKAIPMCDDLNMHIIDGQTYYTINDNITLFAKTSETWPYWLTVVSVTLKNETGPEHGLPVTTTMMHNQYYLPSQYDINVATTLNQVCNGTLTFTLLYNNGLSCQNTHRIIVNQPYIPPVFNYIPIIACNIGIVCGAIVLTVLMLAVRKAVLSRESAYSDV
jgi:hypothetical protein